VCGECALETCEGMPEGHICSKCRGDEGKCIDGYSADEYAERQTNILSGVVDQPEPDFGPEAFNRYQDQREGGPWVETPMPLQEWAKELAINHQTLRERLKQWPVHKALTEPLRIASQSRAVKRALGIVPSPEAVYQRRKADERKLRAIGTRVRIPSDPFGSIEESKS